VNRSYTTQPSYNSQNNNSNQYSPSPSTSTYSAYGQQPSANQYFSQPQVQMIPSSTQMPNTQMNYMNQPMQMANRPQQQQQQQSNQQQYGANQMQIHAQQSNQQPTPGAGSNQGKVKKAVVSINDNNPRNNNNNSNQTTGANQPPVYGAALINSQPFIYNGSQTAPPTTNAGGNQYIYPHGQFQPPNIRMLGPQGNQQGYYSGPIEQGQQAQQQQQQQQQQQPGAQQQYYYSPAPFNPMIPSQTQFVSIGGQQQASQTQQGSQAQQSNNQQHPPSSSTPSMHNQSAPHTPSPMPQQIYNPAGNANNQSQQQTAQHSIPISYQSQMPPYNYMPAGYLQSPINQQQAGFPLQPQPYNPYSLQPFGKIGLVFFLFQVI